MIRRTGFASQRSGRLGVPPLAETHAHLHLTDEQYWAGGGDLAVAMKNVGPGENELLR